MIWALVEILLPMLITFLFGLLIGWLLWRRRSIEVNSGIAANPDSDVGNDSDSIYRRSAESGYTNAAERSRSLGFGQNSGQNSSQTDHTDSEDGSARDDGSAVIDDQGEAGDNQPEQASIEELAAANANIRSLVAELDVTRTRLQACEKRLYAARSSTPQQSSSVDMRSGELPGGADASVSKASQTEISGGSHLEASPEVSAADTPAEESAALVELRQLQQKYQELEATHAVASAELAKNQHLESRVGKLNQELAHCNRDLAEATQHARTVAELEAELKVAREALQAIEESAVSTAADGGGSSNKIAGLESRVSELTAMAEESRSYQSQVAVLQVKLQQSESKVRQIERSDQRIEQLDSQLQTRLADELERSRAQILELEEKASQASEKSAQLVRIRSRIATLETELGVANSRAEDAQRLQHRVSELETMLKGSEVKRANERLVEAEAQLRIANARVADQQQQMRRLQEGSGSNETDIKELPAVVEDVDLAAQDTTPDTTPDTTQDIGSNHSEPVATEATQSEVEQPIRKQRGATTAVRIPQPRSDIAAGLDSGRSDAAGSGATDGIAGEGEEPGISAEVEEHPVGAAGTLPDNTAGGKSASATTDVEGTPQKTLSERLSDRLSETGARLVALDESAADVAFAEAQESESTAETVPIRQREQAATAQQITGEAEVDQQHSEQAPVTRFGTPGASHKDDLKVIRGIGPVLERTLNDAEIQTWEQLAALSPDQVGLIEQSMDFPGRMTRERWVEQAIELVALYPDTDNRPKGKKLLPK